MQKEQACHQEPNNADVNVVVKGVDTGPRAGWTGK